MDMMNTLELSPEKKKYLKSITGAKYIDNILDDVTILDIINWLPENIFNYNTDKVDYLCIEKYETKFFRVSYENHSKLRLVEPNFNPITVQFTGQNLIDVLFDMLIWYFMNYEKS